MALKIIKVYENFFHASRDKQWLLENNIQAFIMNELTIQTDWLLQNAVHGIQLQVFEEDIDKALEILAQDTQEVKVAYQIKPAAFDFNCPQCGSNHIYRDEKPGGWFGLSILILGFPFKVKSSYFHCRYCGHEWKHKA